MGCGLAEIGLELERRGCDTDYIGLDIHPLLTRINELNLPNKQFITADIQQHATYDTLRACDVVIAAGTEGGRTLGKYIGTHLAPEFVVLETHSNRASGLNECAQQLVSNGQYHILGSC